MVETLYSRLTADYHEYGDGLLVYTALLKNDTYIGYAKTVLIGDDT